MTPGLKRCLTVRAAASRAESSSSRQRMSWQAPSRESGSPSRSSSRKEVSLYFLAANSIDLIPKMEAGMPGQAPEIHVAPAVDFKGQIKSEITQGNNT